MLGAAATVTPFAAAGRGRDRDPRLVALELRGRTPNWARVKTIHGWHIYEERAKWNESRATQLSIYFTKGHYPWI